MSCPMREDPTRRLPVVGVPLLRVIEQMVMIEHPLIGRRSHRHRAYVGEKARERVLVTFRTIDLEEPIERIVLVRDVPVEARCRVVLGLRHAVTLRGLPRANILGWARVLTPERLERQGSTTLGTTVRGETRRRS
jgi:hypothetical protein